jgi:hypothetical protein
VFLLPYLLSLAAAVRSEELLLKAFEAPAFELSLSYPVQFETLALKNQAVVLALKHAQSGYPTLNVVVQPGPYLAWASSEASQTQRILESYKLVGINMAKAIKAWKGKAGNQNAFFLDLEYTNGARKFVSTAAITSGLSKHFIITYIDQADTFEANLYLRNAVFSSIQIAGEENHKDLESGSYKPPLVLLIGPFLVMAAAAIIYILIFILRLYRRRG